MKRTYSQKGFTLVELAIVMTIIGLLIGGILKGQELMENARVTATIAQVKAYEAATTTFRDSYNAFPGDMPNAATRVPNCANNCDPVAGAGLAGNSIIGDPTWGGTLAWAAQIPATGMAQPPAAVGDETELFWMHLLQADLISGVTDSAMSNAGAVPPAWGITHPAARTGGGFVVGYADGTLLPGLTAVAGTVGPAGTVLMMVPSASDNPTTNVGVQVLSPSRAAQIDRKMDDGKPTSGFVQGYGTDAAPPLDGCTNAAASPEYSEANTRKSCGLMFRIQG